MSWYYSSDIAVFWLTMRNHVEMSGKNIPLCKFMREKLYYTQTLGVFLFFFVYCFTFTPVHSSDTWNAGDDSKEVVLIKNTQRVKTALCHISEELFNWCQAGANFLLNMT